MRLAGVGGLDWLPEQAASETLSGVLNMAHKSSIGAGRLKSALATLRASSPAGIRQSGLRHSGLLQAGLSACFLVSAQPALAHGADSAGSTHLFHVNNLAHISNMASGQHA